MRVDHAAKVPLGARLPMGRRLKVQAQVRKLGRKRPRDEHRVLLRVRKELFGQPVLVMSGVDAKCRHAGADPVDVVLPVRRVVGRRRARRRDEETKLVERNVVEEGKKDLAQGAVGECVPDLAPGSGRRSERHLASSAPHRGRAWTAGCFHRLLSMERAWGRIESIDGPASSGRWLSGRKHPPAKRVGGVKLPRGFESLPSRLPDLRWEAVTPRLRLAQIDRYKLPIRAARKGPTMEHQDFAATPPQADLDAQPLESVMTLHELLAHRRVRGLSVGQCVDGSPLPTGVYAHAHQYPKDSNRGWVCIRSPRDILRRGSREISTTVMHEFAHLLVVALSRSGRAAAARDRNNGEPPRSQGETLRRLRAGNDLRVAAGGTRPQGLASAPP